MLREFLEFTRYVVTVSLIALLLFVLAVYSVYFLGTMPSRLRHKEAIADGYTGGYHQFLEDEARIKNKLESLFDD